MRQSDSIVTLLKGIDKVKNEVAKVSKDGKNPHFKSTYPTLTNVLESISESCANHNIVFTQIPDGENQLTTIVMETSSGEYIESTCKATPQMSNPQGTGSLITYLRRYALVSIFGLGTEDDDGNGASIVPQAKTKQPQPTEPRPSTQPAVLSNTKAKVDRVFDPNLHLTDRLIAGIRKEIASCNANNKPFDMAGYLCRYFIISDEQIEQVVNRVYGS